MIDLLNSNVECDLLVDFPVPTYQATAGLLQNQYPFICGGTLPGGNDYLLSCYVYDNGVFNENVTMPKGIEVSAGIVVNEDTLWIIGGAQAISSKLANFQEVLDGKYNILLC